MFKKNSTGIVNNFVVFFGAHKEHAAQEQGLIRNHLSCTMKVLSGSLYMLN